MPATPERIAPGNPGESQVTVSSRLAPRCRLRKCKSLTNSHSFLAVSQPTLAVFSLESRQLSPVSGAFSGVCSFLRGLGRAKAMRGACARRRWALRGSGASVAPGHSCAHRAPLLCRSTPPTAPACTWAPLLGGPRPPVALRAPPRKSAEFSLARRIGATLVPAVLYDRSTPQQVAQSRRKSQKVPPKSSKVVTSRRKSPKVVGTSARASPSHNQSRHLTRTRRRTHPRSRRSPGSWSGRRR
jgi:hypothetical protein